MDMELEKLDKPITPADIVVMSNRLVVPIYQRLFVWDDTRIEQLLSDLYDEMPNANPYYIGIITVRDDGNGAWELVDGQQRMTFMTMLGCLLCYRMKGECNDTWYKFVWYEDRQPRIGYVGRDEDQEDIKSLFSAGDARNPNFRAFISAFNRFVENKTKDQLKDFSNYCYKHASFLVNALPAEYDAYDLNLYFEKMNSTGQQLSPVDIVKGKWFGSRALEWNECLNFDEAVKDGKQTADKRDVSNNTSANNQDLTIESFFNPNNNLDGINHAVFDESMPKSRLVMRPEVLLLHVLYICKCEMSENNNENLGSSKYNFDYRELVKAFSDGFTPLGSTCIDINTFMTALHDYRKWIDNNLIYLKDDGNGAYDYRFRTDKDDEDELNNPNDQERMRQFQSMLYVSGGEDQKWVLDAYFTCRENEQLTLDLLKNQDVVRHESKEGHDGNKNSADKLMYYTIDRYWFWKLDYLLWEDHINNWRYSKTGWSKEGNVESVFDKLNLDNDEHRAVQSYVFRANRSIEHFRPQTGADGEWIEKKDGQCRVLDSFGNLCMISSSFNSTQSDDTVNTKCGRIDDQIKAVRLESIKMLLMRKLAGEMKAWTPEKAITHGKDMLKILFPESSIKELEKA